MTAPCGSVTVPKIVPRKVCAISEVEMSSSKKPRFNRSFIKPPSDCLLWMGGIVDQASVGLPATKFIAIENELGSRGNRREDLEVKCQSAAYRARGLHQIDGPSVLAEDRHIALGKQVADFDDYIHMSSQRFAAPNGLTQENIEERIGLSGRGIEHIHRCQRAAALQSV